MNGSASAALDDGDAARGSAVRAQSRYGFWFGFFRASVFRSVLDPQLEFGPTDLQQVRMLARTFQTMRS